MAASRHVLIVEDDPQLVRILQAVLKNLEIEVRRANTGRLALQIVMEDAPAIVLLDMRLPDMMGTEVLKEIRQRGVPATVIAMTAHGSVDLAVEAMRAGAYDFLTKPLDFERVRVMVHNAVERHALIEELDDYRTRYERTKFRGLRGSSPAMQRLYRQIRSIAPGSSPVLFVGETGTEKRLCARALHDESTRAASPFIVVDAAVDAGVVGEALAQADGGTLLLEDIDKASKAVAATVFDVLRTGEAKRADGSVFPCKARILATCGEAIKAAVDAGTFDEDLHAALSVSTIRLPRLRDRGEDILDLAEHLLAELSSKAGKAFAGIGDEVEVALMNYAWPGNTDELASVLATIVAGHSGRLVTAAMLPPALASAVSFGEGKGGSPLRGLEAAGAIKPLWQVERDEIEKAVRLCDGNVLQAARLLEVSPGTIYRKQQSAKARPAS